uniref:Uncharacterized protein n=1 Tax=Glossina brevipalpis TaxID=37001 RepID=A0A1A9WW43_9MUSC
MECADRQLKTSTLLTKRQAQKCGTRTTAEIMTTNNEMNFTIASEGKIFMFYFIFKYLFNAITPFQPQIWLNNNNLISNQQFLSLTTSIDCLSNSENFQGFYSTQDMISNLNNLVSCSPDYPNTVQTIRKQNLIYH